MDIKSFLSAKTRLYLTADTFTERYLPICRGWAASCRGSPHNRPETCSRHRPPPTRTPSLRAAHTTISICFPSSAIPGAPESVVGLTTECPVSWNKHHWRDGEVLRMFTDDDLPVRHCPLLTNNLCDTALCWRTFFIFFYWTIYFKFYWNDICA